MRSDSKAGADWAKVCYGIDSEGGRNVSVRAERKRGGITWRSVPFDGSEIEQAVASGAAVAVALSPNESLTSWIEAPFSSPSKARKVFPTLLDIKLPFALEDCVYEFVGAAGSDSASKVQALAVAARVADVREKLAGLGEPGIDPHVLDQEGLALWTQSLREHPGLPGDVALPRVVVCLREDRHTLAIGRGDRFLSAHSVRGNDPAGMERLLRARLGAVVGENASDDGTEDKSRRVQWVWCGSGAEDSSGMNSLKQQLEDRWPGPSTVHADPSTFVARALATRALLPGLYQCNLRKDVLAHSGTRARLARRSFREAFVLLLSGLLLCGVNTVWNVAVAHRARQLGKEFNFRVDELLGYHLPAAKGAQAMTVVRRSISEKAALMQPFVDALEPSLLSNVAEVLGVAATHNLRLKYFSIGYDRVNVMGTGAAGEGSIALHKALRSAGYDAELDEKVTGGREASFSISAGGGS